MTDHELIERLAAQRDQAMSYAVVLGAIAILAICLLLT